ncbi:hypothetical protein V1511DRAFT_497138 [Dipodascopsis uninucleata]
MSETGRAFPVYIIPPKTCPHSESHCGLTSTTSCCWCLDSRPELPDGRYPVYVDGLGTVNVATRWQMYCGPCKDYWDQLFSENEDQRQSEGSSIEQQNRLDSGITRSPRNITRAFRNAFGSAQEISRDDYVSPVTSMFQRAIVWPQRQQQREQQQVANAETENIEYGQTEVETVDQNQSGAATDEPPEISTSWGTGRPEPLSAEELVNVECKICFAQAADTVFFPCNHLIVCSWCAEEVAPTTSDGRPLAHSGKRCPICRNIIRRKFRIYRS